MTRKRSFLLLIWLVCVALLTHATPALADKRVALVIGNANYKNTPALTNPANDATDVARALTAVGFEVTLAIDVDKRKMDQALADFARASTKADASLFYYAGHGMQFQGRNYIMPVDADLQDEISLRYEMTAIDEVKAAVRTLQRRARDGAGRLPQQSARPAIRPFDHQQHARHSQRAGLCASGKDARHGRRLRHPGRRRGQRRHRPQQPVFGGLPQGDQGAGLEIGTMFRRIGEDVYQATNGRQSPELSISVVREYYLNQAETDQAIWARIRASADADTIREFLNRYPSSFFAPDAKARLDLLDDAAREKVAALQLEQQKAQAARLQQEQAAREKIAAEARAREQDLAAKLATAEAERQQMAAELAQKAAAQADADRREQSDRAKAEDERQRREADLRAQIAQQQATASQMEKDRLLRGALAKDGEKQKADEQVLNASGSPRRAPRRNCRRRPTALGRSRTISPSSNNRPRRRKPTSQQYQILHNQSDFDRLHGDLEMGPVIKRNLRQVAAGVIIAVVALLVVVPVLWTLLSAFKHTVDIETSPPILLFKARRLDNFADVIERASVRVPLKIPRTPGTSVGIATTSAASPRRISPICH